MAEQRVGLKATISADMTQFAATMRRASSMAQKTAAKISAGMKAGAASIARVAGSATRAASRIAALGVAVSAAITIRNLKAAYDLGGALSDLSAQTGITVKELTVLQRAFEDNGVAGDKVGSIVNKMQRSLSDLGAGLSTQVRAFERLGITYDEIERKTPLQQFEMIQRKIAQIEDPTKRAATAMEIFGRSGGEMLALFADSNAIGNAATSLGSASDILDRNAQTFDRISDLLNGAGAKLQQFFLGMAEVAAPKLLEVLERFNTIDFAGIGSRFANAFNFENFARLLGSVLIDAFNFAAEVSYRTMRTLFSYEGLSFIGEGFLNAVKSISNRLHSLLSDIFDNLFGTWEDFADEPIHESSADGFINRIKKEMGSLDIAFSDRTKAMFDAMFGKDSGSGGKSEADAYDAEREEQRKRVAADAAAMAAANAANKSGSGGEGEGFGNFWKTVDATLAQRKASEISATATRMAGHHQAGFSGLAGLEQMQLQRLRGDRVGANSTMGVGSVEAVGGKVGAISRNRLNGYGPSMGAIGASSTSGGIGAKRAVEKRQTDEDLKRQTELAKSSEEHLMDIKETIGQSLSVN